MRPVFVDDGGHRKVLLVRTGYLAAAAFLAYLIVIGFSLTALPSGIRPPAVASAPSPAPARVTAATRPPAAAVAPRVVTTPPAVELLLAPVRRARPPAGRAPTTQPAAPSRRARDTDKKPAAVSKAPVTAPTTAPTTARATARATTPTSTAPAAAR